MNKRVLYASFLIVIGLITVATLWLTGSDDEGGTPGRASAKSGPSAPAEDVAASSPLSNKPAVSTPPGAPSAAHEAPDRDYLARSLRGTQVDGRLRTDQKGNLVITRSTRDVFDYFLSTYGEKSLNEIVGHIKSYIKRNLPQKAARQAIRLLNNYVDYKTAAQAYLHRKITPRQRKNRVGTMAQVYRRLKNMRREYFSRDEAKAMFGAEEAYGQYALKQMRVQNNDAMSQAEKKKKLAHINDHAPAFIRSDRQHTVGYISRERHVAKMRANGASKSEVFHYRASQVGRKKARRLARVDASNRKYKKHYAEYAQRRKTIADSNGLSETDKRAAIERLRKRYFNSDEIAKARVEDKARANDR